MLLDTSLATCIKGMTFWPSKTWEVLILNPAANQLAGGHPRPKFKKKWIHSSLTFTMTYTTDKHNLIFVILLLWGWWRWHCYLHPNYLCLNMHHATFDYSNLEAYISKTKNDRNKLISDSKSWHLGGHTWLKTGSNCTNNIHVQRDVQKNCFIYLHTTLMVLLVTLLVRTITNMYDLTLTLRSFITF